MPSLSSDAHYSQSFHPSEAIALHHHLDHEHLDPTEMIHHSTIDSPSDADESDPKTI